MFTRDEAHWLAEAVRSAYVARSATELIRSTLDEVGRRWELVVHSCEELTPDASFYVAHDLRARRALPAGFEACIHDNPLIGLLRSGRSPPIMHLAGMFSRSAWENTDHYNGIARPTGFDDQLVLVLQDAPTLVAVSLFPEKPFATSVPALLHILQPHLRAAWQRVRERPARGAGLDSPRIGLSPRLRPHHLTSSQRWLLRTYFPLWRESSVLPAELSEWVAEWLSRWNEGEAVGALHSFVARSARGRLLVRCFPPRGDGGVELLLTEVLVSDLLARSRIPLTAREQEVLHWITQGKRDAEIAIILGTAPKTVSKHVENILRKLHVETRTAAVSIVTGQFGGD